MSYLSFNRFAFVPETSVNESHRLGALVGEYFQANITINTNEGSVQIPTTLSQVFGLIDLSYVATATADPTDSVKLSTDGVISSGLVTITAKTEDIANGTITVRGILMGVGPGQTLLTNSPTP